MSVGPRAEKFNTVSNDHGSMHRPDFSVFDGKFPFWVKLVKKSKLSVSAEIWYLEFDGDVHFFLTGITPFGQTWSKRPKLSV